MVLKQPLSLASFVALGYNQEDMIGIKNFYLTTKGVEWLLK